jgi:small GTP-binding protein
MSFTPLPEPQPQKSQVIKVLVVGGPETGKTCLLQSFNGGVFDEMYVSTVKSDLVVKELRIGAMDVSAQLWDIGGSSPMGKSFLRGTHAVLLVADLTSCGSMDGLDALYERVCSLAGFADDNFPCALIGNKLDLVKGEHTHHREVTIDDLRLWAKARRPQNPDSISFYEVRCRCRWHSFLLALPRVSLTHAFPFFPSIRHRPRMAPT